MDCFLLVDKPRSGVENMQTDHQMLCHAASHDRAFLRLYEWSAPTLTLGYFQKSADRREHRESSSLDCVRRATGGGAIVHHHDWTYSLALPPKLLDSKLGAAQHVYDCIHDTVVEWLTNRNFAARKWSEPTCRAESCSFLCFERRSLGDVIIGESKVMGSAQRRYKGALLQHGSLLLKQSQHAPSLLGLEELLTESEANDSSSGSGLGDFSEEAASDFANAVAESMTGRLGLSLQLVNAFSEWIANEEAGAFGESSWELKR